MSYRHTLEAVKDNIHEIDELIHQFPVNGNIPSIEMDLALQKLRNLYELMLLIKNEKAENELIKNPDVLKKEEVLKAERAITESPVASVEERKTVSVAIEAKEIVETREVKDPTKENLKEKEEQEQAIHTITKKTKQGKQNVQTLADQFMGKTTLHESLHQNYTRESENLAHTKPVLHLLTAIGINDRFTFIRELFNNDQESFEKTIEELNNASNFNEAYKYMTRNFEWDMDGETVQMLLDIIRRKYITSRHE